MTPHDSAPADKGMPEEELIHLALPGLLPENHILVLNPEKRIVVLLHNKPDGETRSVREQTFTPSAMRILITLLQAYPHYCRYEVLLAQLYPISVEEVRRQFQEAWNRRCALCAERLAVSLLLSSPLDCGCAQYGVWDLCSNA